MWEKCMQIMTGKEKKFLHFMDIQECISSWTAVAECKLNTRDLQHKTGAKVKIRLVYFVIFYYM